MNIRNLVRSTISVGAIALGATATQSNAAEGGEFISLPKHVSSMKLYGDARFRYQYENAKSFGSDSNKDRSRWRYRVRIGTDMDFKDSNFSMGIRAETAKGNDSTNANFGGYFDKVGDELFVGLAFLKYDTDDMTILLGKHKKPFKISSAWWDSDINPEGISETFAFGDVSVNLGQYIIDEEREDKGDADDFLFIGQAVWGTGDLTLAPIFMVTTGGTSVYGENAKDGTFSSGENSNDWFHDFFVVALPFEYKLEGGKLFGTVGINLAAEDAAENPDSPFYDGGAGSSEDLFFNFGYKYGSAKKAGQWEASAEYRYVEAAAYTPNLSDSDFAKGSTNQEGFVLKYKYMQTDFFSYGVSAMLSDSINKDYGNGDAGGAISKGEVAIIQLDASIKF